MADDPVIPPSAPPGAKVELGYPVNWGVGSFRDDFIPQLYGTTGIVELQKMADTDETIGSILWLIDTTISQVNWQHKPSKGGVDSDDPKALDAAKFADSLMIDMRKPWSEHVEDALSMIWAGFAPCEIVLKQRNGVNSRFDDMLWGVDHLPLRDQSSIINWDYSADRRDIVGMQQMSPNGSATIPYWKLINYRIKSNGDRPWGRALDPTTPIPTPDGWRTMDDLKPGDKVFDENGRVRYVVARRDWQNRPCYRVRFSGGHDIIADANHQWVTLNRSERNHRKPGAIRTTEEMAQKVRCADGISNHGIAWAGALDYPEQLLPLNPYYLGLWLGDGDTNGSRISCHADDVEETASLIQACGFETQIDVNGGSENGRSIRVYGAKLWARDSAAGLLRVTGVLGNKHIPPAYLRGSINQRLAILAGLMDSDGHVMRSGSCQFDNTNHNLAQGVAELVRSLGVAAHIRPRTTSHGTPAWRVSFTPDFIPFRLSRKAARCKQFRVAKFHYVEAIERVQNRRTVCIQVDSPSHLFLAGYGMVPTHNSLFYNAYRVYRLKQMIQDSEAIGIERELCGLPVFRLPNDVLQSARGRDSNGQPTPEAVSALAMISAAQQAVRDMRYNRTGGLVLPSDPWSSDEEADSKSNNPMYDFAIMKSTGQRAIDARTAAKDYDFAIARTSMMQFLQLGQRSGGSNGLSSDQSDLAIRSLTAICNKIARNYEKVNRLVWQTNAMDLQYLPRLVPSQLTKDGIEAIGTFFRGIGGAQWLFNNDAKARMGILEMAGIQGDAEAQADVTPPTATLPPNPAEGPVTPIGAAGSGGPEEEQDTTQ